MCIRVWWKETFPPWCCAEQVPFQFQDKPCASGSSDHALIRSMLSWTLSKHPLIVMLTFWPGHSPCPWPYQRLRHRQRGNYSGRLFISAHLHSSVYYKGEHDLSRLRPLISSRRVTLEIFSFRECCKRSCSVKFETCKLACTNTTPPQQTV